MATAVRCASCRSTFGMVLRRAEHCPPDRFPFGGDGAQDAGVHDQYAVCQSKNLFDIGRMEKDSRASRARSVQLLVHHARCAHVKSARRILGDEISRTTQQLPTE